MHADRPRLLTEALWLVASVFGAASVAVHPAQPIPATTRGTEADATRATSLRTITQQPSLRHQHTQISLWRADASRTAMERLAVEYKGYAMYRKIENQLAEQFLANPYQAAVDYYQSCLVKSAKATVFLEEDHSFTLEQAAVHRIGFSDRSLGKQLPNRDSEFGRQLRDKLVEHGIYKSTGHETLRGCVTFPLFDDSGKITGIYGHRIDKKANGPKELVVGSGSLRVPIQTSVVLNAESAVLLKDDQTEARESEAEPTAEKKIDRPQIESSSEPSTQPSDQSKPSAEPKPSTDDDLIIEDGQLKFIRGDRHYRVRGLEKNMSVCQLKVQIMASRDDLVHLDTLDLVKARARVSFIKAAASELYVEAETIKKDIGKLLLKLELLREQQIAEAKASKVKVVELTEQEKHEALELLRDPNLLERIVADMDACGIVGESTNKLTGYLAAFSRKLNRPLAIVIQSSSSAGKTSLMDAILAMMPEEDQVRFSAVSGQSLYYLEHNAIKHKILAISEDEGITEATYALKLLQSEGELRHATVGKSSEGRLGTQEYYVEGPTQIFLTTTAEEIDEELVNRCLVLTVDETRKQTGAIHELQRSARTLEAKQACGAADRIRQLHQNAQRMLRRLEVNNPYAEQLTFANDKTRLRRDHEKYLNLIDCITLLHQYQRETYTATIRGEHRECINVEPSDIAVANGIAGEVLGQSLDDLAPQARNLLLLLHEFVGTRAKETSVDRRDFRFTRRDVRESTGWSDFQVRTHLKRLVELEYVLIHRGKNGQRYVYELLYNGEGREGQPFLPGLIDPSKLKAPPSRTKNPEP